MMGVQRGGEKVLIADAVIIGAGVIGLAIARELASYGLVPFILDKADGFGTGTSSRSSEVIHAGIYYEPGSLKAVLCSEGRDRLYDYCTRHSVPHRRVGKLIFASEHGQLREIERIWSLASANGVHDLRWLEPAQVREIEPALECAGALFSPSTGIIDSHSLMAAFLGEAESCGARFVARANVTGLSRQKSGWGLHLQGDDETAVRAKHIINCAGLHAHEIAAVTEGLEGRFIPSITFAKGNYFAYAGKHPFRHLIYPTPEPGGLGTHLTLDLSGSARFGPDVEWISAIDYNVDEGRHSRFFKAAQKIWPAIEAEKLVPAYCGIRPKIASESGNADFIISGPAEHGLEGLINLFGIESPGLTASLAIARRVGEMVR